jgi:ComF family protein
VLDGLRWGVARFGNLFFPSDCAVCESPLTDFRSVPVCASCLNAPEPMVAEFACRECQTPFLNEYPLLPDGVCAACRLGMVEYRYLYCFGSYDGALARLIHLFKYQGMKPLAEPLGRLLVRALPRHQEFDLIVPVPLHWWKQWRRGFNQSAELARVLSRHSGIPWRNALRRRRATEVQAGLTRSERRRNVAGAFAVDSVTGKKILLVDDVITTGSTVAAISRVLRRAGAAQVSVIALARVDRRLPVQAANASSVLKSQSAKSGAI